MSRREQPGAAQAALNTGRYDAGLTSLREMLTNFNYADQYDGERYYTPWMSTEDRAAHITNAVGLLLYFLNALDPTFLDWERLGEIIEETDGDRVKIQALTSRNTRIGRRPRRNEKTHSTRRT